MQTEYPHNIPWQYTQEHPNPAMPLPPAPQPGFAGTVALVPNDRYRIKWRGYVAIGFACLGGVALISIPLRNPISMTVLGVELFLLLFFSLLFLAGILALQHARRWQLINQRRQQVAAWGSAAGVALASPQPFPNIEALPPGCTIKLKANWPALLVFSCLLMSIILFLEESPNLLPGAAHQGLLSFIYLDIYWLILIARLSLAQRIIITPELLSVRHALFDWFTISLWGWRFGSKMIPWSEARLFAIRDGKPGAPKVRYELSGPFKVVTFSRILRPRWWALYRPAQPFGEYNAQMDALLALISARTGLPLYDVR